MIEESSEVSAAAGPRTDEPAPPPRRRSTPSFSRWLRRPETLVGLSAVLLSVCGLFVAVYEASLFRRAQRASVWPHLVVAPSIASGDVRIRVENSGLGPARVRSAAVTLDGERKADWADVLAGLDPTSGGTDRYQSLINGRVLAGGARGETIFALTDELGSSPEAVAATRGAIGDGRLDVLLCYCSVYDQCWEVRLQDVVQRLNGVRIPASREVEDCEGREVSGI